MDDATTDLPAGHVVLCGLNELGHRTLEELRRMDEPVVVVARAPAAEQVSAARTLGAVVVEGNYRDGAVLRSAGVPAAVALVVIEDDDIGNLHAALAAQDLNPDLRIRLRMFNQELGRRVEQLFRDCRVFDAAALAAPAFVAAALHHDWRQRLEVDGRVLVVRQASAGDPGVLLPLAHIHDDGTADIFPTDGDDLLCLTDDATPHRRTGGGQPHFRRPGRLANAWAALTGTDRRLRLLGATLLGMIMVSIVVFRLFGGLDLVDAIYFVVTIVTTTGFGDITLRQAPPALQLYGVCLMLFGAASLAILFALLADALIGARLTRTLGALPRRLKDHVIVCGLGNIGYRVVEQLVRLDVPVVAVEVQQTNRFLPTVRRLGVPVLIADIRLTDTLQALHVGDARSVVVVTSSDLVNLEVALNARGLSPDLRVVLRLFDPDLAARVERAFDIHISRSPAALAASAFAAATEGERVLTTVSVGVPVLVVARVRVDAGSDADGSTVAELQCRTGSRVVLLKGGGRPVWRPRGPEVLVAGQEVVVVVPRSGLMRVVAAAEVELASGSTR